MPRYYILLETSGLWIAKHFISARKTKKSNLKSRFDSCTALKLQWNGIGKSEGWGSKLCLTANQMLHALIAVLRVLQSVNEAHTAVATNAASFMDAGPSTFVTIDEDFKLTGTLYGNIFAIQATRGWKMVKCLKYLNIVPSIHSLTALFAFAATMILLITILQWYHKDSWEPLDRRSVNIRFLFTSRNGK